MLFKHTKQDDTSTPQQDDTVANVQATNGIYWNDSGTDTAPTAVIHRVQDVSLQDLAPNGPSVDPTRYPLQRLTPADPAQTVPVEQGSFAPDPTPATSTGWGTQNNTEPPDIWEAPVAQRAPVPPMQPRTPTPAAQPSEPVSQMTPPAPAVPLPEPATIPPQAPPMVYETSTPPAPAQAVHVPITAAPPATAPAPTSTPVGMPSAVPPQNDAVPRDDPWTDLIQSIPTPPPPPPPPQTPEPQPITPPPLTPPIQITQPPIMPPNQTPPTYAPQAAPAAPPNMIPPAPIAAPPAVELQDAPQSMRPADGNMVDLDAHTIAQAMLALLQGAETENSIAEKFGIEVRQVMEWREQMNHQLYRIYADESALEKEITELKGHITSLRKILGARDEELVLLKEKLGVEE